MSGFGPSTMYRTPIANLYSPEQYKKQGSNKDKSSPKAGTSSKKQSSSQQPPKYTDSPSSSTDSLPAYADATSNRSSSYPDEKKQVLQPERDAQGQKPSKRAALKSLFTSNPQRHNAMHVLEESATGQPSAARQSKSSGKQAAPKPGYWQELPEGRSEKLKRGNASELTPPSV